VDLENSVRLRNVFKQKNIFIAESGIKSREDMNYLKLNGINVFLIGESLMRGSF
jgi:indole-3-glycerol phosphate synthase